MPTGLGQCGCGVAPYGIGTPDAAPIPGGGIFVCDDGSTSGSRKIDAVTGRPVYNAYGRAEGMPDMQHDVLLAAKTALGSAADPTLGQDLATIQDISSDIQARVRGAYERAFAHLTGAGLIAITSVTTQQTGDGDVFAIVRWRDLTTNTEHDLRVP